MTGCSPETLQKLILHDMKIATVEESIIIRNKKFYLRIVKLKKKQPWVSTFGLQSRYFTRNTDPDGKKRRIC